MSFVALVQSGKVTELLLYFSSIFVIINKLVLITTFQSMIKHTLYCDLHCAHHNQEYSNTNQEQYMPEYVGAF